MRRFVLSLAAILATSGGAAATAQDARPVTVSPGRVDRLVAAADPCPTFSWGGVGGAAAYELAVVRAPESGGTIDPAETTWRTVLPGTAQSFTPDAGSCLTRGERYAWLVRARIATGGEATGVASPNWSAWSEPAFFEIAAARASDAPISETEQSRVPRASAAPSDRPLPGSEQPKTKRTSPPTRASGEGSRARIVQQIAPDPTDSASLSLSGRLRLPEGATLFEEDHLLLWSGPLNLALGRDALKSNTIGLYNTGVGYGALSANTTGDYNTALGTSALLLNTVGLDNTALGARALSSNDAGHGNVAAGSRALWVNDHGSFNTALGFAALQNTQGSSNIAIGNEAGWHNSGGDRNIWIGHSSMPDVEENSTIRLGTPGVHVRTFLAGDVAIFGTNVNPAPTNRLHVEESINSTATPANHVALIKNTDSGNSADVLALQIAGTTSPLSSNNFVTFFLGDGTSVGAIEGNGSNSVVLAGGGNDYAEWLPLLDPAGAARLVPGDVVGLHGDSVSRRTAGASHLFVVSTSPIVAGNDPGQELRHLYARVAFVGQAPVKVAGRVRAGELLVASGRDDGMAVALAPDQAARGGDPARLVVGRALESNEGEGEEKGTSSVRALVGLPGPEPWASLLREQSRRVVELEERLLAVERALALRGSASTTSR